MTRLCRGCQKATLIICFLLTIPAPAFAICDAVESLARIHNNFYVMLSAQGDLRARAAARLYPFLKALKPVEFAEALEIGDQSRRWEAIHLSISRLSREIIMGTEHPQSVLDRQTNNLAWIEKVILESGCLLDVSRGTGGSRQAPGGSDTSTDKEPPKDLNSKTSFLSAVLPIKILILLLAGAAILILRSRRYRIVKLGRLPRHSIDFTFDITHVDATVADIGQRVSAVDLSLGGMKIKVEKTIKEGVFLHLHLPIGERIGSVVWSNNFFAGILFEHNLTEEELDTLMDIGNETAPALAGAAT